MSNDLEVSSRQLKSVEYNSTVTHFVFIDFILVLSSNEAQVSSFPTLSSVTLVQIFKFLNDCLCVVQELCCCVSVFFSPVVALDCQSMQVRLLQMLRLNLLT